MNIKQKINLSAFVTVIALSFSLVFSHTAFAVSKADFKDIICSAIEGPGAEETCRKAIDDTGKYTLGATGKVMKLSDWKDKTNAELKDYMTTLSSPPSGDAGDPSGAKGCGGVDTAIIKCNADNSGGIETNGVWALLLMAINILTAGIGIAAVGGIIYGSIMYTSAGDNDGQVKQAKEIIRNVIVGIILYVAMYALLQFIVPGGVFSS